MINQIHGSNVSRRSAVALTMGGLAMAGMMGLPFTGYAAEGAVTFTPGTYRGVGTGNGGDIVLDVTFNEDAIVDITVVSQGETPAIAADFSNPDMGGAITLTVSAILESQSLGVDAIAGATVTSWGVKEAVADAVAQAGGDVDALERVGGSPKSDSQVELEADAVVVGAGASGMAAAVRLAQLGKNVVLVEKTYRFGGAISVSGGAQLVACSNLQKERGVEDDSPESMIDDCTVNGDGLNVPEIIDLYAHNVGATADWLHDECGVAFEDELENENEYTHDRVLGYEGGGAALAATMRSQVYGLGVEVLLSTKAEEILMDDGKVKGLIAKAQDGTTYTIHANDVVLCTGGYGNSRGNWLDDSFDDALFYGLQSQTGDGLTLATAEGIDAATRMLEYAKFYPNGVEVAPGRAKSTSTGNNKVWPMSAILVNLEGERVVNEGGSNKEVVNVMREQPRQMYYILMDADNYGVWYEKLPNTGFNMKAVEGYLEANGTSTPVFAHADTIAEVAQIVGINPEVLEQTVADYNAGVQAGEDEFGRSPENLQMEIGEGTYYMIEQHPRYATTMGGLVVNEKLQVMNVNGEPIQGLHAAGEVVGGVHGSNSASGANNGWANTSGKLAAEDVAAE